MFYDPEAQDPKARGLAFNPFKALVAPRPIGWITTLAEDGTVNLAPYSFFQAVADSPDVVMFSATPALTKTDKGPRFGTDRKHSEHNAVTSGEFVCNLVTLQLKDAMNQTSAHLPAEQSEVEFADLQMLPSTRVAPPRVALAPAALECVVVDSMPVRHRGGEHRFQMVFGEVVGVHINDKFVIDGRVDTQSMNILTRMGYDEYAVLETAFSMTRPDNDPILGQV